MTNAEIPILQPAGFPPLPAGWTRRGESLPNSTASHSGMRLFVHRFSKDKAQGASSASRAKSGLLVVHGQGEHGGRYLHLPHYLQNRIDCVWAPDLRGHGRSDGTRGHVAAFREYADDVIAVAKRMVELESRSGEIHLHVLGHSMGGLITLQMLARGARDGLNALPVRSATICAPLLGLKLHVPAWKKAAAHMLSRVWGGLQMETALSAEKVSHDPAVQKAYLEDRLVHGMATPKYYVELQAAMAQLVAKGGETRIPTQFLVPMADEIVDPSATQKVYDLWRAPEKRYIQYEGFRHEALNEGGDPVHPEITKERPLKDIEEWISRFGNASSV